MSGCCVPSRPFRGGSADRVARLPSKAERLQSHANLTGLYRLPIRRTGLLAPDDNPI
jgi:hypothetical protein